MKVVLLSKRVIVDENDEFDCATRLQEENLG